MTASSSESTVLPTAPWGRTSPAGAGPARTYAPPPRTLSAPRRRRPRRLLRMPERHAHPRAGRGNFRDAVLPFVLRGAAHDEQIAAPEREDLAGRAAAPRPQP